MRRVIQSPALYAALALYAAGLSYFTSAGLCFADACGQTARYTLLGYPWGVWGAVFYAAVAGLFVVGAVQPLRVVMLFAVGVHVYLVAVLVRDGISCLLCLHLAFLALGLAVAAFTIKLSPLVARRHALLLFLPAAVLAPVMFGYAHSQRELDLADALNALQVKESRIDAHVPALAVAGTMAVVPAVPAAKPEEPAVARSEEPASEPPKQDAVLPVFDAQGAVVSLNLMERPALLFSWWCSACGKVLSEPVRVPPGERPVLVARIKDRNSVQTELQRSREKAGPLGPVHYVLEPPVEGVPALLWHDGEQVRSAVGAAAVLEAMDRL